MDTVASLLKKRTDELKLLAKELLENHSSILFQDEKYLGESLVLMPTSDFWGPLDTEGNRIRSQLKDKYSKLYSTVKVLLKSQPDEVVCELEKHNETLHNIVEQDYHTWLTNTAEAAKSFNESMDALIGLIDGLYDSAEGTIIYVADTNALLFNLDLEKWEFDECTKFTIIITPTVLSELDKLKINRNNENVRNKAEGLVSRIKGYRSRGKLSDGVPL